MRRMFRSLLWMATVAAIVRPIAAQQASALPRPTVGSIERLDPALDALIAPDAPIEQLAIGFEWSEGPVWRASGGYLLFSDVPKNTIYKWQDATGLSVFLRPADGRSRKPSGRARERVKVHEDHARRPLRRETAQQPERSRLSFER